MNIHASLPLRSQRTATVLFIACCLWPSSHALRAGLTGENVALVVNRASANSLTIANHYAALRHIPPQNIFVLDDVPDGLSISLDSFRDAILRPVLEAINARHIAPQISVIAYSAGFPTSIKIDSLVKRLSEAEQSKYRTPIASINALTYFYRWVLSDRPEFLGWASNLYARGDFARHFANPFAGDKGEQFQAAIDAGKAERFEEAAETFETLADEFPTLSPLRILAAENWLRANKSAQALAQVGKAVKHGWVNRRYLTETEPLSKLFAAENGELTAARQHLLDQLQDVPRLMQGPISFSATSGWTSNGHAVAQNQGGMPYMLSCMLAVIHENGSTLPHAVASLTRAATSDRTYPEATFGFSRTNDVRSITRFPVTADALAWLLSRDKKVEIFSSNLPTKSESYVGMMLGASAFSLSGRTWTFAPGAIAENLTSFGGVFENASQTKLTDLLDGGAAISSGTVTEPYALPPKFPTAMMYAYYGEGVTAIEAFYLTIQSPYQLLIVGDPLCQPFARAPNDFVNIETGSSAQENPGADESQPASAPAMQITWQPIPDTPVSVPTEAMELYLNGKLASRTRPTPNVRINLAPESHGVLDVRVVLIGNHPTHPQIAIRKEIILGGESSLPQIKQLPSDAAGKFIFSVQCDDAERIEVRHLGRVIAMVENSSGEILVDSNQVGRGPVRLQAIAWQSGREIQGHTVELD